jgi:hypothetical protein
MMAIAIAACGAGASAPARTLAPGASAQPTSAVASEPPAPTAAPATPAATPTPAAGASYEPGLTDEEWAAFAGPWNIQHTTADPPPPVTAAEAEAIVRERYAGDRPLVWSGLVAVGDGPRVGWMVVLGTAPGQACPLHAGLLERALEGGIVDAATGDIFFTMTCG